MIDDIPKTGMLIGQQDRMLDTVGFFSLRLRQSQVNKKSTIKFTAKG